MGEPDEKPVFNNPRNSRQTPGKRARMGNPLQCGIKDGRTFVTDGGHFILDAALQRIADPGSLAERLAAIPGVVEHGLFVGLAHVAVIAGPEGRRIVERPVTR